jgi:hypothetical protein
MLLPLPLITKEISLVTEVVNIGTPLLQKATVLIHTNPLQIQTIKVNLGKTDLLLINQSMEGSWKLELRVLNVSIIEKINKFTGLILKLMILINLGLNKLILSAKIPMLSNLLMGDLEAEHIIILPLL